MWAYGVTFIQTYHRNQRKVSIISGVSHIEKKSFLGSWVRRYLHDLNFIPDNMNKSFKNVDMLWGDCISQIGPGGQCLGPSVMETGYTGLGAQALEWGWFEP